MSDPLAVTPSDLVDSGTTFAAAAESVDACRDKAGELAAMVSAPPGPGGGIGGMVAHFAEVLAQACRDLSVDATGHGTSVSAAGTLYATTDQAAASRFGGAAGLPGHPAI